MNQSLSMDQAFLNKLNDIILDNLHNENFSVGELSREMGMSYANIHRKLKSLTNKPVSQYIREIRLQQAKELLQQKVATAGEVAFRVGFNSPTYFNKCFHDYFGFPPGEVKRLEEYNGEKTNHMIMPKSDVGRVKLRRARVERTKRKRLIIWVLSSTLFMMLVVLILYFLFSDTLFQRYKVTKDLTTADAEKSIAILPFKNLSNDPEQDWFSEGMKEEIMNHLLKIGDLKISSGLSTMRFKETKFSIREIARELGVTYVLEGSVSKSDSQIRVIVRLINGNNEKLVWTENYKRAMTAVDILDIQSDIAIQVAENLKAVIQPELRERIKARATENTEAYTLYLQVIQGHASSYEEAMQMLERAMSLDPDFADAYAELAYTWMWYKGDSLTREQTIEKVEPLLNKALQLDKYSIRAHAVFSEFRLWFYWDLETVEKEYQIYKQLHLSNTEAIFVFVQYLWAVGRSHEAYLLIKDAFERDEISLQKWVFLAVSYYFIGEQEKALETVETALRLFPRDNILSRNSSTILVYSAKYEKVIALFEKDSMNNDMNDIEDESLGNLAIAYIKTGNISKGNTLLNELLSRNRDFAWNTSFYFAAIVYTAIGEKDKAIQLLEKAYTSREKQMVMLKADPSFLPLHGDPQFEDLLMRIGFN